MKETTLKSALESLDGSKKKTQNHPSGFDFAIFSRFSTNDTGSDWTIISQLDELRTGEF